METELGSIVKSVPTLFIPTHDGVDKRIYI